MAAAEQQPQQHPRRPPPGADAAIRVLDTSLVHPSPPAPPETSVPLTFFDIFWLHVPPVQRVIFYRLAPDADVDAVLSSLRRSLSHAVRAFFPLAGRLRLAPGTTTNRYELHYRPGDDAGGVVFTVAEYDGADSLDDGHPRKVAELASLAPPLSGGAVLAVQATVLLSSCSTYERGLAIGVTVHRAACDGAASMHFLHTWAATCRTEPPPPLPVIDRTLVSDPRSMYDLFCPAAAAPTPTTLNTDNNGTTAEELPLSFLPPDEKLLGTFVLSRDHLQHVKDVVTKHAGATPPPRCSSLVATLGLVWSCYQRAKHGTDGRRTCCLLLPVDHRSRTSPPLPATYLGNCFGPALATAPRAELAAGATGALWAACAAVAAAVEEAARGMRTESMATWGERVLEAVTTTDMLTVAGSPRFRVYELDFGFGRPAKVDIVSVAKTGAIAVAESRDGAVGGMEVGVALPPDGMDAFRRCFADAIAALDTGAW